MSYAICIGAILAVDLLMLDLWIEKGTSEEIKNKFSTLLKKNAICFDYNPNFHLQNLCVLNL